MERIVAQITQEVGYINLLVANAGVTGPIVKPPTTTPFPEYQKELWDVSSEAFDQTFSVNVGAVYFSVAAFLPLLTAGNEKGNLAQSSQVVITSSIGSYGRVPMAHFAYSASKAAVTQMAKQMSTAFTKHMIRFNVIAPGCEYSDRQEPVELIIS